ncbi:hypothetical protein ACN38_g2612 [Penicillium nordicum]|uniref:Uncharacterized protein n=1 Tax=Penicillium nordicum TaxID=229535 RepID=A0A0M9WIQ3_9EURO|nr:hypothetical protein ACN38_g2612 [Penicillium nordicum]
MRYYQKYTCMVVRDAAQQQVQQFSRTVACQQVFDQGPSRHCIHIHGHRTAEPDSGEPPIPEASHIRA